MKFARVAAMRAWRVVLAIACIEGALSWLLAVTLLDRVLAPLAQSPDAARTLFAQGGRGLLDLRAQHHDSLRVLLAALGCAAALYALLSIVAGGALIVALASRARPSVLAALAAALRRAPTLIALASCALLGLVVCAAGGAGAVALALRATRTLANERTADLCVVASAIPALLFAWVVVLVHDAARVHALATPSGCRVAIAAALGRVARGVGRLALGAGLVAAVGGAITLAGAAIAVGDDATWFTAAVVVATRAGLIVARVAMRAAWLAVLGRPWLVDSAA